MNPLYIDEITTCLNVKDRCLNVWNPRFHQALYNFKPRQIPYDAIIIQRGHGHVSFDAMNWLIEHSVSLVILNREGNILTEILPREPIANQLRVKQYQAYLDKEIHYNIARTLVSTKIRRQRDLLDSLSRFFKIDIPKIEPLDDMSIDFMRNNEARYAVSYFNQYGKICRELGHPFINRNITNNNMKAGDIVNSLLNYSYAILQTYVRRSINSIGLDNSIPFLHDLRPNRTGLVFDIMELWRANCDYGVLLTLEELKKNRQIKVFKKNESYEVLVSEDSIKILVDKLRLNLSLQEIIDNTRQLAKFLIGKNKKLVFNLKPIEIRRTDNIGVKQLIQMKTAKELGINKSTLWYQKKRLNENGTIRIYIKTRQYYA